MAWETGVQSQVKSYQRLKKWYSIYPSLTLSILRYESIWAIDETLTSTTTPGQSGSESDGNEWVLHIPLSSRLEPHHQMQFNVYIDVCGNIKS